MQKRRLRTFAILGLLIPLFVLLASGPAHAWWDGKWKYRKKVILDTTPKGADTKEALTDFPVLVRLHSGNFTFENAKNDGSDIRFVASDDKTPLKYHVEQYDPKTEMVLIWVKVPQVAPASSEGYFWVYYGNNAASSGDDPGGTYDVSHSPFTISGKKRVCPRMRPPIRTTARSLRASSAPPPPSAGVRPSRVRATAS